MLSRSVVLYQQVVMSASPCETHEELSLILEEWSGSYTRRLVCRHANGEETIPHSVLGIEPWLPSLFTGRAVSNAI